ncbi:MAG: hypothetical protein MRY49_01690 [Candidatus Pacebacteria bacterium]|nr:hypothetical protein [Candidatus Paceibacterota bacterium]
MKYLKLLMMVFVPNLAFAGALAVTDVTALPKLAEQIQIMSKGLDKLQTQVNHLKTIEDATTGAMKFTHDTVARIRNAKSTIQKLKTSVIPDDLLPDEAIRYGEYTDMIKVTDYLELPESQSIKKWVGDNNVRQLLANSMKNMTDTSFDEISRLTTRMQTSNNLAEKQDITNQLLKIMAETLNKILVLQSQVAYATHEAQYKGVDDTLREESTPYTSSERWGYATKYLSLDKEVPCTKLIQKLKGC